MDVRTLTREACPTVAPRYLATGPDPAGRRRVHANLIPNASRYSIVSERCHISLRKRLKKNTGQSRRPWPEALRWTPLDARLINIVARFVFFARLFFYFFEYFSLTQIRHFLFPREVYCQDPCTYGWPFRQAVLSIRSILAE